MLSDNFEILVENQDDLFVELAQLIAEQCPATGDRLPAESELAAKLGVGRQRLREALSALELAGAISVRKGAGRTWEGFNLGRYARGLFPFLTTQPDTARELLEVRHALETAFLPKTAARLTPEQLGRLRELTQEMVHEAENDRSFAHLDRQFHLLLYAPLKNDTLNGLLESFWIIYERAEYAIQAASKSPQVAAMHGLIVEAIAQGDIQRAVYELDAHFYGVERALSAGDPSLTVTAQQTVRIERGNQ